MPVPPRHRLPLALPGAWPACAQGVLRSGGRWLHAGAGGGWGVDWLVPPGGPLLEARWDGHAFVTAGGLTAYAALEAALGRAEHPWIGAASFELACWEAGLPFQPPPVGTLGMSWLGAPAALRVADTGAELWGWTMEPPAPEVLTAQWGGACALDRPRLGPLDCAWPEAAHAEAVMRIRQRIHDGDFYVANLCVPFSAPFQGDPLTLALARFRSARPPFGAWLPLGDTTLIAFTMERLLSLQEGRLATEPIKGSAPRTGTPEADARLGETLSQDPKERAEHTMIVDLLRNDLGRVAATGSVAVQALMALRSYPTVQHLVSRVEAELRTDVPVGDLLRAVLPGGSVTGAPKRAVCAHLATAEAGPRGFYCGALGWIGPGGRALDLALPIRTAQLTGDLLTYWAGGGITRRSDPAREWQELAWKTQVLQPS